MTETSEQVKAQEELNDWGWGIPARKHKLFAGYAEKYQGFDKAKVLTGHVLDRILTDDDGAFGTGLLYFDSKVGRPQEADEHRNVIIRRMGWELAQKEMPAEIRRLLEPTVSHIAETGWSLREDVERTRKLWHEKVYAKTKAMVDENQNGLGDALKEFRRLEVKVQRTGGEL